MLYECNTHGIWNADYASGCPDCMGEARKRIAEADARIAVLENALREAIESVEDWAGYASEYFQDKHDLAGDLQRLRSFL